MEEYIEILEDEEVTEEDYAKAHKAVRRLAEHDYSSPEEREDLYELVHKVYWEELMDWDDEPDYNFCDDDEDSVFCSNESP